MEKAPTFIKDTKESYKVVESLMNPMESSSEDEPIAVIRHVIKAEAVAPGDGEWDIEAALTRRGAYPSWDLDWLQQLLSDKI